MNAKIFRIEVKNRSFPVSLREPKMPVREDFNENVSEFIVDLEQLLDARIPQIYLEFINKYNVIYKRDIENFRRHIENYSRCDLDFEHFYLDPKQILDSNRGVREGWWPMFPGDAWPKNIIAIGDNGCGDYWAIEAGVDDYDVPVIMVNHEDDELSYSARSIWEHIQNCQADIAIWVYNHLLRLSPDERVGFVANLVKPV